MTASNLSAVAANMSADILTLKAAGETGAKAQVAFARSTIAAVLSNLSTLAFAEAQIIALYGNPKDSKGAVVKTVRALVTATDDAAFPVYQAWRVIKHLADNADADQPREVTNPTTGETVTVGTGAIRDYLTAFALGGGDVRGLSGAKRKVDEMMTAMGDAIAAAMGIVADDEKGTDKPAAPVTIDAARDMVAKLALALAALSDADFDAIGGDMQTLVDGYDARLNAIADAKAEALPLAA